MKRLITILAGVVIVGASAAPALAQDDQVVAPPGNSGIEEYLEIVPAAGGDRPAGGGRAARARLDAKTVRALRRLGPDGRAAAAAVVAGGPGDAPAAGGRPAAGNSARRGSVAIDNGGRAGAVAGALAGSGGMGLAFPLLLLGIFAAALGLVAIRRVTRRR